MYLEVLRGLAVCSVIEAIKPGNPFLSRYGRALNSLAASPLCQSAVHQQQQGSCCVDNGELADGWQSCWACSSGLWQDVFLGYPSQAQERGELRPDGHFYKGLSLLGIEEVFHFHCLISMWAKRECSAVLPAEPKHALWNIAVQGDTKICIMLI